MSIKSNTLMDGIISEAEKKAESIKADALKERDRILAEAEEELEKKKAEEMRSLDIHISSIRLKEESAKRSIDRLREIKTMDSSYQEVMLMVEKEFSSLAGKGELSDALVSWIVEAAIGLDKEKQMVQCSQEAPVDENMLRKAEKLIKEKSGNDISLVMDERICPEIGVVLSTLDRKISYNNLLSTRIRRYQKEIRKILQEENAR